MSILVPNAVSGQPLFVIVIFSLHLFEVNKEIVALSVVLAEVELHAGVEARLEAGLLAFLVVVKVLVEVWHLLVR